MIVTPLRLIVLLLTISVPELEMPVVPETSELFPVTVLLFIVIIPEFSMPRKFCVIVEKLTLSVPLLKTPVPMLPVTALPGQHFRQHLGVHGR